MPVSISSFVAAKPDGVADDDGHFAHVLDELFEDEALLDCGDVAGGGDGRLDDEDVDAGVNGDRGELLGVQRRAETAAMPPAALISRMRSPMSSGLIGSRVDLLHERGDFRPRRGGDLREDRRRIVVARLHALEVEDGEAAELARTRSAMRDVDDAVHGRRENGS